MKNGLRRVAPWAAWIGAMVLITLVLHDMRTSLQQVHVALLYLLIVLGGSAYGGRILGFTLACLGFLAIDYFFQAPFDRLSVGTSLDWFVLLTFVATAGVATNLLARAQAAAARAQQRAEEIARLSRLGSELLSAGRAEEALGAIAEAVRAALHAATCTVFRVAPDADGRDVQALVTRGDGPRVDDARAAEAAHGSAALAVMASGAVAAWPAPGGGEGAPGSATIGVRALVLPLQVHDRIVGVLGIAAEGEADIQEPQWRFLDALTYYAALAVERVELVAEVEHAEALREADRMRAALLASVSHDLRTPLSTIKALAQDTEADPRTATANAVVIEEQADRLARMVNNLLDVTRLRGNAFPVQPETNAAEDLVGALVRQVTPILGTHALTRRIDGNGAVLLGRFDFVQSLRILTNLVENAARHAPAGTPIELVVRPESGEILFEVADRGPGVPAAERERIFEPFYRVPTAAPDVGGIGLGLFIARALAEAQHGSLTYEPRDVAGNDEGGGSRFVLRLPADESTATEAEEEIGE